MCGAFEGSVQTVVTTWFGTFLFDGDTVVRSERAPDDPEALAERARQRRAGELTPEETRLLRDRGDADWSTRDRRLAEHGLRFDPEVRAAAPPSMLAARWETLRAALLVESESALVTAWDPSIHVEEAVRAVTDLERIRNQLGERLASWVARDAPDVDSADAVSAVRAVLEGTAGSDRFGPPDERLVTARQRLARLYRETEGTLGDLSAAVEAATPGRAPNLVRLLGPELAARLLAAAGGLNRLARLPASTIQVLGAERAFFEHLRGHAPPPRHGLLFIHPTLQSAPRRERGRLARALAGKAAIAARRDRAGAPAEESLARAYEARRAQLMARRGRPPKSHRRSR